MLNSSAIQKKISIFVLDNHGETKSHYSSKMKQAKTGLVLEGGGMRGMFTSGVLDVLLEAGINFDGMVGVSAGALFGSNFKSRQRGRAIRYNMKYIGLRQYMSYYSLFTTGHFVNNRFSYYRLPYELDPFDFDTYESNPIKFWAVVTDIEQGKALYHEISDARGEGLQWMRASASMPIFAQPLHLGGHTLLDGGIADSIPLEFMHRQGYARNLVILTQPVGFRKKPSHLGTLLRLALPHYPKVAQMITNRHEMYNAQLDYILASEHRGDTLLIYPEQTLGVGRLEMDTKKVRSVYDQGVRKAQEMLPTIKRFLRQ